VEGGLIGTVLNTGMEVTILFCRLLGISCVFFGGELDLDVIARR
jgi:hypothetical protein